MMTLDTEQPLSGNCSLNDAATAHPVSERESGPEREIEGERESCARGKPNENESESFTPSLFPFYNFSYKDL